VTFGGDHSGPLPIEFALLTPYLMMINQNSTPAFLFLLVFIVSLIQMPIYGWILGSGWVHHRFRIYASILAGVHIVAGFVGYWMQAKAGCWHLFRGF
jgi:hypothetical protein